MRTILFQTIEIVVMVMIVVLRPFLSRTPKDGTTQQFFRVFWLWSVLGDNSPWITNVSTYLVNRSTECLCSGIIFGDVRIANSLGRQRVSNSEGKSGAHLQDIAECGPV